MNSPGLESLQVFHLGPGVALKTVAYDSPEDSLSDRNQILKCHRCLGEELGGEVKEMDMKMQVLLLLLQYEFVEL